MGIAHFFVTHHDHFSKSLLLARKQIEKLETECVDAEVLVMTRKAISGIRCRLQLYRLSRQLSSTILLQLKQELGTTTLRKQTFSLQEV